MTPPGKPDDAVWHPPTPSSSQIGFHSPKLPCDHLVLLPPPLVPTDGVNVRRRSSSEQGYPHPFYPSHLLPPLHLPDPAMSNDSHVRPREHDGRESVSPATTSSSTVTTAMTTTTHGEDGYTTRPRRSAAIVAARNIPRQPSPFELNESDDEDSTFSPPPPSAPTGSSATKSQKNVTAAAARGESREGGGVSKRKVSHSLIERRRREKINDCLAALKDTVPNLREEGERKIAKAKERGKKRGRSDDAGAASGLHKLEILQGTIEYISELRARVEHLETGLCQPTKRRPIESSSPDDDGERLNQTDTASRPHLVRAPSLTTTNSFDSSSPSAVLTSPDDEDDSHRPPVTMMMTTTTTLSHEEADHAASMLLYFSTSPELRPVHF